MPTAMQVERRGLDFVWSRNCFHAGIMGTTELVQELRERVAVVRTLEGIAGEEQVLEEWARLVTVLFQFALECTVPQELRHDAAE